MEAIDAGFAQALFSELLLVVVIAYALYCFAWVFALALTLLALYFFGWQTTSSGPNPRKSGSLPTPLAATLAVLF